MLSTHFNGRADWLRAGQALQRFLLTATIHGLAASPLTQPLEVGDAWLVRDPRAGVEYPQMIVRFGYRLPVPGTPPGRSARYWRPPLRDEALISELEGTAR